MAFNKENASEYGKLGGRPGYELEQAQLTKMRELVDKDLKVIEKIYAGKGKENDFKILQALQVRIGKYLDKLHAGKTDMNMTGELRIVEVPKEVLDIINEPDSKTK